MNKLTLNPQGQIRIFSPHRLPDGDVYVKHASGAEIDPPLQLAQVVARRTNWLHRLKLCSMIGTEALSVFVVAGPVQASTSIVQEASTPMHPIAAPSSLPVEGDGGSPAARWAALHMQERSTPVTPSVADLSFTVFGDAESLAPTSSAVQTQEASTPISPTVADSPSGTIHTLTPISQPDVAQALNYVTTPDRARPSGWVQLDNSATTAPQTMLMIQLNQHIDDGAGQVVDVVVEAMPEKPSETEIKDAKDFMAELHRDVLAQLTKPSKVADEAASRVWDLSLWILGYMCKKIATAAKKKANPIMALLATRFPKLRDLFDPSTPGQPKSRPIGFVAERLNCSKKEAEAMLKAGPFTENTPGSWGLEDHTGVLPPKALIL
jgi:hypothetical protein